jgi:hypothetical protein
LKSRPAEEGKVGIRHDKAALAAPSEADAGCDFVQMARHSGEITNTYVIDIEI